MWMIFTGGVQGIVCRRAPWCGAKIYLAERVGVKVDGDNLVKTSSGSVGTSWEHGLLKKIPANTNGWIEATAGELVKRAAWVTCPPQEET